MKKILLLLAISISLLGKINAQCSPDFLFTALGLPGVYPPELPIAGIPMVGISNGVVGVSYSQTLTVVNLPDTNMDVASFLPAAVVTTMNVAGISTVMTLNVNHIIYSVSGLPSGLSDNCDQTNCQYNSGIADGCILINGIPMQSGNFTVPVDMTINVQIPAITDPILGTTIFAGMGVDLPTIPAVQYDLLVTDVTAINEAGSDRSKVFPNPTFNQAILSLVYFSDVLVYNILGKEVLIANNIKGDLLLSKNDIGKGVFYISVQSKSKTETIKLIVK